MIKQNNLGETTHVWEVVGLNPGADGQDSFYIDLL